jgi:hypothetical protein
MRCFIDMKWLVLILAVTGLSRAADRRGYQLSMIESSDQAIVCDVVFDSASIVQQKVGKDWYSEVVIPYCAYTDQAGLPKLPVTSLVLGIPPSGTLALSIENENTYTRPVDTLLPVIVPADNDPETGESGGTESMLKDWYPGPSAETGIIGFVRDQRIMQIELQPVRYLASARLVQIVRSLRLRINVSGSAEKSNFMNMIPAADSRFESLYKTIGNYDSSLKWRKIPARLTAAEMKIATVKSPQLKISVDSDGLYGISGQDLINAGVDLSSIIPSALSLRHRDEPVPLLIEGYADGSFDPGDRIIFWGEHNRGDDTYLSWYSDTNVYWLSWEQGTGARYADLIGSLDPAITDTLVSAKGHIHLEKDIIYSRFTFFNREDRDHWFWDTLNSGDSGYRYKFSTNGVYQNGTFQIKVGFHGQTHPSGSPDHHVAIALNGTKIGDIKWDEQSPYEFISEMLPNSLLTNLNEIVFTLPGDLPTTTIDQVLLNYIDVVYDRTLEAREDSLIFTVENPMRHIYHATGFKEGNVHILTTSGHTVTNFTRERKNNGYEFSFVNRSTVPTTYMIIGDRKIRDVKKIEKRAPADLTNLSNGADYIVITHADFMSQALKLANYRSSQGMRTFIVDIQDIYDIFNDGIYDPRAIKDFLKYAYRNWSKPAPLYVLLFGDTTHKMDKSIARQNGLKSFVPTMMLYTNSWGMTSSDNYFVSVNGDDELPDMYIGRLPANTAEEADIMVQKILDHETRSVVDEWRRHVCMLTGTGDFFEQSAQYLIDTYLPKNIVTDWVATQPASPYFGSTEDVARLINNGETIVNFIGHGGGGWFSDAGLFEVNDIERLFNKNRYPVTFSLTCFIGHFDNDELPSLAEVLLRAPDKGIVANFGSSGRAYLMGNYYLNNALFEAIFRYNIREIGIVATWGKIGMVNATRGYYDHVKNFNVLGDPATRLYFPPDVIDLELSKKLLLDNDKLTVHGHVNGYNDGTIILSAYNERDSLLVKKELALQNGAFDCELLQLTTEVRKAWSDKGGRGLVRAYFSNGNQDGASAADFNVSIPFISSIKIEPAHPVHQDSVFFDVQLDAANVSGIDGIKSVEIEWSSNYKDWQKIPLQQSSTGEWRNQVPLVMVEGIKVYYKAVVTGNNDAVITSAEMNYAVAYRPDLTIPANSIGVYGTNETMITASIKNDGDMDAGAFHVQAFNELSTATDKSISPLISIPRLKARSDTTIAFALKPAQPGLLKIQFVLDEENTVNESNEKNNRTEQLLQLVSSVQGSGGPVYFTNNSFYIRVPESSLNHTTAIELVELEDKEYIDAARLSSLMPIRARNATSWRAYAFRIADSSVVMLKPVHVAIYYNANDSLTQSYLQKSALRLYTWNSKSTTWQGLPSTIETEQNIVSAEVPVGNSIFSLLASSDTDAPAIQISIEGQNFADGDIVSPRPVFTISAEDTSGFDFSRSPVSVYLDGAPIDDTHLAVFHAPESRRQAVVTFTADVTAGDHQMTVEATDVNGNKGSNNTTFTVAGEFELAGIANHPNPFAVQTTIAFTLLDMAEKVDLDIYTVSGRLIRSMTFMDITGYIEWDWDGLDQDGDPVANGVYYLKFVAKKGGKKIERIEKMAKLE